MEFEKESKPAWQVEQVMEELEIEWFVQFLMFSRHIWLFEDVEYWFSHKAHSTEEFEITEYFKHFGIDETQERKSWVGIKESLHSLHFKADKDDEIW